MKMGLKVFVKEDYAISTFLYHRLLGKASLVDTELKVPLPQKLSAPN